MNLGYTDWLWPLSAVFALGLVLALWTLLWRDRRDLKILGHQNLVLSPGLAWSRRMLKGFLVLGGFLLMLLGALRLQGKPVPEDVILRGSDVVVVLDVSKSMLTQDLVPNRLEAAKKAVDDWMHRQTGNRVGMVVFSGEALVQVPLTFDVEADSMVLQGDDTDAVDRGGTDIGEGIRTALSVFPKDNPDKRGRVILLMTDGELTDGASNLNQACADAKTNGVPIVTVGMGTPQGKPIPDGTSFWGEPTFKKDASGNVHVSQLDEKTLQQIASSTGGVYVSGDSNEDLGSIDSALENIQKTEMKGQGTVRHEELAPSLGWMAAGTLLFSALL
jgi:Ca-activated chloride channel family protein